MLTGSVGYDVKNFGHLPREAVYFMRQSENRNCGLVPLDTLVSDLALKGGAIVCTDVCSEMEIAFARTDGRMTVIDSIGYVRRTREWLNLQKKREEAFPVL